MNHRAIHVCTTLTVLLVLAAMADGAENRAGNSPAQSSFPRPDQVVLVEAEGFAQSGGWVVDPQFMDQMGSPYLLAHGLGRPVADATTEVDFPVTGTYRVWVRTKDWVAQWNAPGAPGRFQLLVGGRPLETVFGTEGARWHWQDGGRVSIAGRRVRLTLHDLTGFEGRCDAILFARDEKFTPPNRDPEMVALRRRCLGQPQEPEAAGKFDFVVAGGGIAGACAALSAARLGMSVAIVQDRPVLGGNNSSEVRVWLQGARNKESWPRIGDVVAELEPQRRAHYGPTNTADIYEDEKKLAVVRAEPNIRLFLEHRVVAAECEGGTILAVVAQEINSGRRVRIAGRWFADCTGDAAVGALAGADVEIEPKGHMGPCNLWNVCECEDTNAINTAVAAGEQPQPFPRCPWALDLSDKPFPGRSKSKPDTTKLGGWYWESGFDRDPIAEMEAIRDWNFRAMYGAWDAMKNVDKVLPNHRLNWAAYILGKRESRRLLGDVMLSLEDLEKDRRFPDGCVPTGWSNDLHRPDPRYQAGFEGNAFISTADFGKFPAYNEHRPYWIPYRCLYSRNIANLFMAGRDLSVAHEALGAVRVMRTCGCMGEVVGMAASLCRKYDTTPRAIYAQYLSELQDLMRRGVGKNPGANPDYENGAERRPKPADQRPAGIETGVAAYSIRHLTAFEAIEKTKQCGGEIIELFLWQKLSPDHPNVVLNMDLADEHIAALKARLQATGVRAVNAYFNNEPFRDKANVEANTRKLFEFARKLGLRGLTGEPPVEYLDLVEKLVKEYDIQLCFHNHPKDPARPEYRNWEPAYLLSLMDQRDARMGFSVDTGHLSRSGVDPVEAIRLLKGRVLSVHLKDVQEAKPDSDDLPYGQGIGNVAGVLAELKRQNFRGHVAVEYEHTTDHLLDDVKHCLDFMRSHLNASAASSGMMSDSPVTFPTKEYWPLVQMIDDWNQNRKLAMLAEARLGKGKVVICSMDLESELHQRIVAAQFRESLLAYMQRPAFQPATAINPDQLRVLFK